MNRAIVIVALVLVACVRPTPIKPSERTAKASEAQLYKAALRVIVDEGQTPETNDPTGGLVVTEWGEVMGVMMVSRYRWRIAVDEGRVRVDSDCQERAKDGTGSWSPCGIQPDERLAMVPRLANAIASRAEEAARSAPQPAAPVEQPH